MTQMRAVQLELFSSDMATLVAPTSATSNLSTLPAETANDGSAAACHPAERSFRAAEPLAGPDEVALPATLSEVLRGVQAMPPGQRRSDLMSAVNVVAQVLDRPLGNLPASPAALAPLLAAGRPLLAGLSQTRWSRVRTNLRAALRVAGYEILAGRDVAGPAPEWAALLERLPDRKLKHGLSRLFSYLSRAGITTASVSTDDLNAFYAALVENSLHAHPERTFRTAMTCWNGARNAVPSWPDLAAPFERDARKYALAAEAFPEPFMADVEAYLGRMSVADPFSRDYHRELSSATLQQRRRHIMQTASALVASGFPKCSLTSLSVLVQVEHAEAALRYLRARHGGKTGPGLGEQARSLLTIARHWVRAPEDHLRVLSRFASGLAVTHQGMAPGVQARLRQFDLRPNLNALLVLPDRVYREFQEAGPPDRDNARRLMLALAVELLTMAPMRMANLSSLSLDRHFQIQRRGRHRSLTIWLSEAEVKNRRRLVLPVPASTAQMIHVYWSKYQPLLADAPNSHIFPSTSGTHRDPSALGAAISKFILRETGLVMHPHLFRQLAAKLSLDAGGGLETARLLLGHSSSETTERHYVHLRTDKAYQHLDATISKLRNSAGVANPQTLTGIKKLHGS